MAFKKNMRPKKAPEMIARRFPSTFSGERLSKKNTTIPVSAMTMTNTLRAGGTFRCSIASKSATNAMELYWSTMALPTLVSLLAYVKVMPMKYDASPAATTSFDTRIVGRMMMK